jgi:hypothetical protein
MPQERRRFKGKEAEISMVPAYAKTGALITLRMRSPNTAKRYLDDEIDQVNQRIQVLRHGISALRAQSLEVALCQLSVIDLILDLMWSSQMDPKQERLDQEAVKRMLFSIREVLAPMCPASSPAAALYHYEYTNPWLTMEERVELEAAAESKKPPTQRFANLN